MMMVSTKKIPPSSHPAVLPSVIGSTTCYILITLLLLVPLVLGFYGTTTPTTMTNRNRNRKRNNTKKEMTTTTTTPIISVVGPDYIQVLQGNLLEKQVALILCGESHQDAIDVTRRGGNFDGKEGWIRQSRQDIWKSIATTTITTTQGNNNGDDNTTTADPLVVLVHVLATAKKMLPLQLAQDWAKTIILQDSSEDTYRMILVMLWIPQTQGQSGRVLKGMTYVIGLTVKDEKEDDDDDDDDSDDGYWIRPRLGRTDLASCIQDWVLGTTINEQHDDTVIPSTTSSSGSSSSSSSIISLEWGDLDHQAFQFNRRRLTDEEISMRELDTIIEERKQTLKAKDKVLTWDDWLMTHRTRHPPEQQQQTTTTSSDINVQLILEATVPPWELELHRPIIQNNDDNGNHDIQLGPAADCIRRVEEDEEGDEEDDLDPSSDGIGSYLDFIYRRFIEDLIMQGVPTTTTTNNNTDGPKIVPSPSSNQSWLHCVDMRDLGCQAASSSDTIQRMWKDLMLTREEEQMLQAGRTTNLIQVPLETGSNNDKKMINSLSSLPLEPDSSGTFIKFVPETRMNPERLFLQELASHGKLVLEEDDNDDDDDDDSDSEKEKDEITFPSFEGFFGQNTEFLYYSKHIKLSYSPFLAKCVQSLETWDKFFASLFLGGTISEALSLLRLDGDHKKYMYVRSPIHELEDGTYRHRDDGEHYITYPFFPCFFYLQAKNTSSEPRTWSSNLFAKLLKEDDHDNKTNNSDTKRLAQSARDWTLDKIHRLSLDPKGADDPESGGEWFEAYLYSHHREIYDDIDLSDTSVLLKKKKMESLTSNYKHNIGKIQVPDCKDGMGQILAAFKDSSKEKITPQIEVFAKILIDMYMSCLVDFVTMLKIAEIVKSSEKDKVVIVVYMGTAHTKAVSDFFIQNMKFRRKTFVGKVDWDEGECRKLQLPTSLWDFTELFPKSSKN